jgi:hypothetical protein
MMLAESLAEHPLASVTVTTTVLLPVGVTVITDVVCPPGTHEYVTPPEAVRITEFPEQAV